MQTVNNSINRDFPFNFMIGAPARCNHHNTTTEDSIQSERQIEGASLKYPSLALNMSGVNEIQMTKNRSRHVLD